MTTNARVPPSLEGVLAMSDATCAELREVCVRAGYTEATIAIVSSVPRTVQEASGLLALVNRGVTRYCTIRNPCLAARGAQRPERAVATKALGSLRSPRG